MAERLRRLERIFARRPVYFVTACAVDRKCILATESVHRTVEAFAATGPDHGAWLGAYVLMPDHWHGFVVLDGERISLSQWVRALKGVVSRTLRDRGIPSPHWQKGFFDHVLRSEESAAAKWAYVRENPVRAGLVTRTEDWPHWGEPFPAEFRDDL